MAIEDLIQQITDKVGVDESTAKMATGKTMAMMKSVGGDDLFAQIASAIPGADLLANAGAESEDAGESGGGGLLGTLSGLASSALGGSTGEALGLGSALSAAGIDGDKIGGFVSTIIDFIKETAGEEIADQLLAKVPVLKSLLG